MAVGSAVVAYRTTDAAALIEDRVSGLLCAPGDADDLRRKVHTLLADGDLRMQLGAAAHRAHSALGPTSPDRPQLSDLYQQLIEPERRLAAAS
jgi:glycosyltransferase involved in cell wall biosynthesis